MDNQNYQKIKDGLELENILLKSKENNKWTDEEIKQAEYWYLRHLYLCVKHPNTPIAAISKKGDEVWHQHIIDTRKYATDCNQIAGRFINHTPIYGKPTRFEIEAYEATVALYEIEFNEMPGDKGQTSGNYSYSNPFSDK